jgi:hypothetical protein
MGLLRAGVNREANEERFTLAITPTLLNRVREFAEADPVAQGNVSFVFKRAIERDMEGAPTNSENEASKKSGVSFELNELDQKELARLAEDTLKLDDPNLFARLVIRRALDMGPDVMREFLLGQARREVAANLEAENQARAEKETSARQKTETTKNAPRKARKAA